MDEAKKLVVLEQENEELKRELKELFKTLDQMNQSLNRMIDHYILCRRRRRDKRRNWIRWERRRLIYTQMEQVETIKSKIKY